MYKVTLYWGVWEVANETTHKVVLEGPNPFFPYDALDQFFRKVSECKTDDEVKDLYKNTVRDEVKDLYKNTVRIGKMSRNFIYGLVIDGKFYSNRMFFPINHPNGIYSMDMDKDDFKSTLTTSDIDDAVKFFRKASKIKVIRGIAFHDGIIPENPVSYPSIPLKVKDATYDDFDEVEVAIPRDGPCYFLRIVSTEKAFPLLEIKDALDNKTSVEQIKGVSPDIRIAYTFSFVEREKQRIEEERAKAAEKRKKDLENPTNYIKSVMEESGATVHNVKKVNRGFEVNWTVVGQRINSLFDVNFRVIEAGFCTTGHDRTQSAASVAKLLQDYVKERQHFSITRTVR